MSETKIFYPMTKEPVFEKVFSFTNGYTVAFSDLGDIGVMITLTDNNGDEDNASIILHAEVVSKLRIWLSDILISQDQKKKNVFRADRAGHYD